MNRQVDLTRKIELGLVFGICFLFFNYLNIRFTAYTVVRALKRLAESGKTIVATIHQPSSEIFYLFDDLLSSILV